MVMGTAGVTYGVHLGLRTRTLDMASVPCGLRYMAIMIDALAKSMRTSADYGGVQRS